MNENEIRAAIMNHLSATGKRFEADTDLFEANVIDSMGVLELIAMIEKQLKIFIDQDDLVIENFRSVNKIVQTLAKAGQ